MIYSMGQQPTRKSPIRTPLGGRLCQMLFFAQRQISRADQSENLHDDRILSWMWVSPLFVVVSLGFSKQGVNSKGFLDNWSLVCHRRFVLETRSTGQLQEETTNPLLLICAALVLPPRCDTSEGLASIPQKQKMSRTAMHILFAAQTVVGSCAISYNGPCKW